MYQKKKKNAFLRNPVKKDSLFANLFSARLMKCICIFYPYCFTNLSQLHWMIIELFPADSSLYTYSYHGPQTEFLLSPKTVFLLLVARDRLYTTWLPAVETLLLCKAMSRYLFLGPSRLEKALQGRRGILENKYSLLTSLIVWYNEYTWYTSQYIYAKL